HLVRRIEVEDTACAVIKWKSGAFGVLEGTTSVTPGMDHRLEFHGELGSILTEGDSIIKWAVPGEEEEKEEPDVQLGTGASDPKAIGIEGHQRQIQDLCQAIIEDRDPMVTGEEARKAVEVILAIYESARTGKPVYL
ncbi:MAG: Gfo/Idh/MocA family oxidoreductase, partial [Armatimonadetes bacterium]|nr:Gfo/Idh/MocA family oxidoreductase [Armatimonadota bacterium]